MTARLLARPGGLLADGAPADTSGADTGAASVPLPKPRSGSEKRQRRHVVRIRVDDAELLALEGRAENTGLSMGAFMRACALETAGPRAQRRIPYDRVMFARANADLNRVGSNLNQIARAFNREQDVELGVVDAAHAELRDVLALMRRALGYDRQG